MVFGEALAGGAAAGHTLFNYNRTNFLYDRKQRQENEYKILEWRAAQAGLWRDDIRDIIGLTEKKMDSYLIVATLTFGMTLGLFTEGRLEPGTPPWLLHFYMLTLSAAFMYLLMAVWFAMHASIVASCSSVRLLTQFVRLPVPTWEQLESMRTYAHSYETVDPKSMLRLPFTGHPDTAVGGGSSSGSTVDPWRWEAHGHQRDLYELQEKPVQLRRHVALARLAARQYQCYDAFARVAMNFGVIQLVNAISYYILGYVAVQDGAPLPAWSLVAIMIAIATALVHMDFSLTERELRIARVLVVFGPACAALATGVWMLNGPNAGNVLSLLLPLAYAAHGLWLLFSLWCCGLEAQPNGALLPMKFRAVLYLDVFGWLQDPTSSVRSPEASPQAGRATAASGFRGAQQQARQTSRKAPSPLNLDTPGGRPNPSGEVSFAPEHVFDAVSYAVDPEGSLRDDNHKDFVTGHDRMHPGRLPAKVFRLATFLVVAFWAIAFVLPFTAFREFVAKPLTERVVVESLGPGGRHREGEVEATVGSRPDGLPEFIPKYGRLLPPSTHSDVVAVDWPTHAGFVPRAISCDSSGKHLVVADELGVYAGQLVQSVERILDLPISANEPESIQGRRLLGTTPQRRLVSAVSFQRVPPCSALEGQALKDIGVVGAEDGSPSSRRVVVLHAHGKRLAECSMYPETIGDRVLAGESDDQQDSGMLANPMVVKPAQTWAIASDWLHKDGSKETVQSLAVNNECLHAEADVGGHFRPGILGCVVLGTSAGRLVQMRGALAGGVDRLVPERAMQNRGGPVEPGSLHVLPGAVVALRSAIGVVQAFDSVQGSPLGEWQLPSDVHWFALCGGGDSLFLLGLRNRTRVELHRFPMPLELRSLATRNAGAMAERKLVDGARGRAAAVAGGTSGLRGSGGLSAK